MEELCPLSGKSLNRVSTTQKMQTNMAIWCKNSNFMLTRSITEEATVSIGFAVASVCLLHKSTGMQINFSLLLVSLLLLVAVQLQSIIPAPFYLGLLGKFSSTEQLIVPARCLYGFIY